MKEPIGRTATIQELTGFLNIPTPTGGLCYLRGRRRVGKSTLLTQFEARHPNQVFYFMGRLDESSLLALQRCAKAWDLFAGETNLTKLRANALTWDEFFRAVADFGTRRTEPILLAFDEIQWIAREKSGFLGALKEHWIRLEPLTKLRILLCGSSNKFFHQMTGGEEKLIRGLKTRADIWLTPLSIAEIKEHYKLPFSDEELLLAYMFFGGIPYYWNQINTELFFIQSVNRTCFTPSSIFQEEYLEMLNLEFQKNSIRNLSLILAQIRGSGVTASQIAEKSHLANSTVGDLLEKLETYNLVFRKTPLFAKPKDIQRGALYFINDFYLNFYFRILSKKRNKIARNRSEEQLFAQLLAASSNQLFISDYTGPMFEHLVHYILRASLSREEGIFQKLNLNTIEFEVGFHWDKNVQFDLVLHNTSDRVLRFIECKWTRDVEQIATCIESFQKRVEMFADKAQKVLCINHEPAKIIASKAERAGVILITPADLI